MKHGKKYVESAKALDKAKLYEPNEALGTVCQLAKAKFDETVEAHIRLGVDSVDFETVWEQDHTEAERTGNSTENFTAWVDRCMKG